MIEKMWEFIAKILAMPAVASWLIERAKERPWYPVEGIMDRYWVFNPYYEVDGNGGQEKKRGWFWQLFPTIRIHHITGADPDPHLHDHPWDCRTIILRGWYVERRPNPRFRWKAPLSKSGMEYESSLMTPGKTAKIAPGQFHKISMVRSFFDKNDDTGAWTLFITWKYIGPWGFLVNGEKMLSREYFEFRKQWRS